MTGADWGQSFARAITAALSGVTGDRALSDEPFLLMLNGWWEPLDFHVPERLRELDWQVEVDTTTPDVTAVLVDSSAAITLTGRSLLVLRSS